MQVQRSQLQHTLRCRIDHYTAEASELRFPVGQWPTELTVPGVGNGNPFPMSQVNRNHDGDITDVEYKQLFGCVSVTVFND